MKNILVVGEANACRSLMAEGWLRYYTKGYAEVTSAGLTAEGLDLHAANSMSQAIMDISKLTSKTVTSLPSLEFDFIIFLFEPENTDDFGFQGAPKILIHPVEKPVVGNSKNETEASYGIIRDEIENFCFDFVHDNVRKMY